MVAQGCHPEGEVWALKTKPKDQKLKKDIQSTE
jgi:hypothetical protein